MKRLKILMDEEIRKLDGQLVIIKLNIQDPKFAGGFSFLLQNGDQIYIEPDLDDNSYIRYLKEIK